VYLRETSDRFQQVQVRDHVRPVWLEARPERQVLREQHRHSVRSGPHRGLGRGQEVALRMVQ